MYSTRHIGKLGILLCIVLLSACGDNLLPADDDKRPTVVAGTEGHLPSQKAADFTLTRTDGESISLSRYLDGGSDAADAVLVYFTMWCSICAAHTSDIVSTIKPLFTGRNVRYLIVDYVSGSLDDTVIEKENNISDSWGLEVLSDNKNQVKDQLHGGMGVTVVIDADGTILYNQDYGNAVKVIEALNEAVDN